MILIALLFALAIAAIKIQADSFQIQVRKDPQSGIRHQLANPSARFVIEKFLSSDSISDHTGISKFLRKRNEVLGNATTVSLWHDSSWYALIGLGSPPQSFKVIFDTGSSDFWVRSVLCEKDACNYQQTVDMDNNRTLNDQVNNIITKAFDPRASSTFKIARKDPVTQDPKRFFLKYGTGFADVVLGADTLTLMVNSSSPVSIPSQDFGASVDQSKFPFRTLSIDGILGLGFPQISIPATLPPLFRMKQLGIIPQALFGYWVGHDIAIEHAQLPSSSGQQPSIPNVFETDDNVGEFSLGSINTNRYQGPIRWIPITRPRYWEVDLLDIRYGNQSIFKDPPLLKNQFNTSSPTNHTMGQPAIFDTGTTLMILPPHLGKPLARLMKAVRIPIFRILAVKCRRISELQPIVFMFRSASNHSELHRFTLAPQQYVIGKNEDDGLFGYCLTQFGSQKINAGNYPLTILGEGFLRNYYSVWDVEGLRIGLADLKV